MGASCLFCKTVFRCDKRITGSSAGDLKSECGATGVVVCLTCNIRLISLVDRGHKLRGVEEQVTRLQRDIWERSVQVVRLLGELEGSVKGFTQEMKRIEAEWFDQGQIETPGEEYSKIREVFQDLRSLSARLGQKAIENEWRQEKSRPVTTQSGNIGLEDDNSEVDNGIDKENRDEPDFMDEAKENTIEMESSNDDSSDYGPNSPNDDPDSETDLLTRKKGDTKCLVCHKKLLNSLKLKTHMYRVHQIGELPFTCEKCNAKYAEKKGFDRHVATCGKPPAQLPEPDSRVKCLVENCGAIHKCLRLLHRHQREDHTVEEVQAIPSDARVYECIHCAKMLSTNQSLQNHLLTHGPELPKEAVCDVCGVGFINETRLKDHQRKTFRCRILQGASPSEATVVCDLCGKSYSNSSNLKKHVLERHERKFRFNCERCGNGEESQAKMTRHLWSAHKIGGFPCQEEGCGKTFAEKKMLDCHVNQVHLKGEPEYRCMECGKGFYFWQYWYRHTKTVHQGADWNKYKYRKRKPNPKKKSDTGVKASSSTKKTIRKKRVVKKEVKVEQDIEGTTN